MTALRVQLGPLLRQFVLAIARPAVYVRTAMVCLADESQKVVFACVPLAATNPPEVHLALRDAFIDTVRSAGGEPLAITTDGEFASHRESDPSHPTTPRGLVAMARAEARRIAGEIKAKAEAGGDLEDLEEPY
jgi:hypothetical protein